MCSGTYFIFLRIIINLHYISHPFYNLKNQLNIMAGTNYINCGSNSTDYQLEKIITASENHDGVLLRISKDYRNGDVHKIPLTNRQINKIRKAKKGTDSLTLFSTTEISRKIWWPTTSTT